MQDLKAAAADLQLEADCIAGSQCCDLAGMPAAHACLFRISGLP